MIDEVLNLSQHAGDLYFMPDQGSETPYRKKDQSEARMVDYGCRENALVLCLEC